MKKNTATDKSEEKLAITLPRLTEKSSGFRKYVSKEIIAELTRPLFMLIRRYDINITGGDTETVKEVRKGLSEGVGKCRRDRLVDLYMDFKSEPSNFLTIAQADEEHMAFWKKALLNPWIDVRDAEDVFPYDKAVVRTQNGWSYDILPNILYSAMTAAYYKSYDVVNTTLTLRYDIRRTLAELFFGKDALQPVLLAELPADEKYTVMDFEGNMPADIMFLDGLNISGSPLSSSGAVSAVKLKTVRKKWPTAEFSALSAPAVDRLEMLIAAYFHQPMRHISHPSVNSFAEFVVNDFPRMLEGAMFSTFFPEYKGFTKSWTSDNAARKICSFISDILKEADKEWMSLDNLRLRYLCFSYGDLYATSMPYVMLFRNLRHNSITLKDRASGKQVWSESDMYTDKWFDGIEFSFLLRWLKFLCGMGLLEIASLGDAPADDPLSGMRYVRLTPLGRYALGLTKTYKPGKSAGEVCHLDFDSVNCIFTILTDACPYTLFLQEVCTPIGSNRYRIGVKSMMQGYRDHYRLKERIEKIRRIIDVDSSPKLAAILDEVEKRSRCSEFSTTGCRVIKLRQDVPGLMNFIVTDKRVRSLVLLAEGGHIIVSKSDEQEFYSLCGRKGYFF